MDGGVGEVGRGERGCRELEETEGVGTEEPEKETGCLGLLEGGRWEEGAAGVGAQSGGPGSSRVRSDVGDPGRAPQLSGQSL